MEPPRPPFRLQTQKPPRWQRELRPKADHGERSYEGSGKLNGRKALITGADSGIGKAVAIAFAREGADVLISYLNEKEDAEDAVYWIKKAGRQAILGAGDITDEAHCQRMIRKAVDEFGELHILVQNAAFQMNRQSIDQVSSEEWDRTFRTNIYACFYLARAAPAAHAAWQRNHQSLFYQCFSTKADTTGIRRHQGSHCEFSPPDWRNH
jgi:NAD(P)-dependent dehydrogenase (short-subunit alcohol dehydrogenase family)